MLFYNPTAHSDNIFRIKEAHDGLVLTASADKTVKVWNSSNNWNLIGTYTNHTGYVYALVYLSNDVMASGDTGGKINIWRINSLTAIRTLSSSAVYSLALLNNGFYLASGHSNNILIWNINDGSIFKTLVGHTSYVYDLAVISDELLASCSADLTVRIWNLTSYSLKYAMNGHTNIVNGIKVIAADVIASGSKDNTIIIWNITSGSLIRNLTNHTNSIYYSLDLFDRQTMISGSYDNTIKLWQISTGTLLKSVNTVYSILVSSIAVIGIGSNTCKYFFLIQASTLKYFYCNYRKRYHVMKHFNIFNTILS